MSCQLRIASGTAGLLFVACLFGSPAAAHEPTARQFIRARLAAQQEAQQQAEEADADGRATCRLTIDLVDKSSGKSLPGLVRVVNVASGRPIRLAELIHRDQNWYSMNEQAVVTVPRMELRIEGVHGLVSDRPQTRVSLAEKEEARVSLELQRLEDPTRRGWRSGNTHLHLMNLTHAEAIEYLRTVPRGDGLDLVFLSHLRRIPDERNYISNTIVENAFAGGDLARLSQQGVLFGNGQEHRHNFGPYGEGYGHVMLLNLIRLVHPVSIGPGLMKEGTDGRPLQAGIRAARDDGATVIWCHNTFGLEDHANWMHGVLHAMNIFDGGDHGSYADSFYRYLNLGMRIPFSTGTDWFIYDFSRVYVPIDGELTARKWLESLMAGRTFITNGVFLELEAAGQGIGDTLQLDQPGPIEIRGRGWSRHAFQGLELVYNGQVVKATAAESSAGAYTGELKWEFAVPAPGWIALRIPPTEAGTNELGRQLFAHTSPIYVDIAGRRAFDVDTAQALLQEMQQNITTIEEKAVFADESERKQVLQIHRQGIEELTRRIREAGSTTESR